MTTTHKLVVVGGGPKAVALAVQAHLRRQMRQGDVRVTVIESYEIGASWSGNNGYTDGCQELCTPSEHDLVFPVQPLWSQSDEEREREKALVKEFTWASFVQEGRRDLAPSLGAEPPAASHLVFSHYLRWAFEKSGAELLRGRVTGLDFVDGKWFTRYMPVSEAAEVSVSSDGVVVTGSGPSKTPLPLLEEGEDTRSFVFDGVNYWSRKRQLIDLLKSPTEEQHQVVVIGGGGAAAAIAADIVASAPEESNFGVIVLTSRATLFSRGESKFELMRALDDDAWEKIPMPLRREFLDRYSAGVVSYKVMTALSGAIDRIAISVGRASELIQADYPNGGAGHAAIVVRAYECQKGRGCSNGCRLPVSDRCETFTIDSDAVVDARGFDASWFRKILSEELDRRLSDLEECGRALEEYISPYLAIEDHRDEGFPPYFHAPNLSALKFGVGVSSLLALGSMAKRILQAYK